MKNEAIIELDVHGMNAFQAKIYIESQLKRAGSGVYRLRIIHGFHRGTTLQQMIRKEFKSHPKVIGIEIGLNQGETDLILRKLI